MKLRLSELASIAEVIGAIAIVVSLIYVGVQVEDSTRAVRSATASETATAISSWYSDLGTNFQASDVFLRGGPKPELLTPAETAQYIFLTHGLMYQYQTAYYLAEEGTLDVELQQSLMETFQGIRELPGFLMYWEQRGHVFQPGFRAFVENVVANGETNTAFERLYRRSDAD